MAQIISATTRFAGAGTRRADFILKAQALLAQAHVHREAGEWDLALESAYQAALRTAGARISASAVAGRRRRPTGAWDQLRMVDAEGRSGRSPSVSTRACGPGWPRAGARVDHGVCPRSWSRRTPRGGGS